jgi:tetratricopeptide (TPR) repeat protein
MTTLVLLVLAAAPRQAESKVREAIGALEKAFVAKDEAVADLFDVSRLLREMERRGAIPDGNFGYRSSRRLEDNLATIASAPGALHGGWNRIEPLNVRITSAGDEAEALCRVTIGGKPSKFRFWLTRTGDSWKAFDLEKLDGTYRLSVIGLQYTPGVHDDEERQSLRDGVQTLQRAAVHLSKGQADGAREALAMARRCTPPEYVMDWIDLVDGQALNALGDPAAGLKAADRVLVRQKDLAVAHRLKAVCHAALGESEKAILAGKEYLKLVGDDAEMWTLIGRASEALDRADQAIEAYRRGADADPQDYAGRLELGRALLDRRRTEEAASFFTAAVGLAPIEANAFERAADLLDRAGAHAEALALTDAAAVRRPDEAPVFLRRGRALRKLGRLKEAEETLTRASKLHPDDRDIPKELVLALAQAGRDGEAQDRMRTAAAGGDWSGALVRAFVHAAAGRPAPSLEELKTVFRTEHELPTSVAWIEKEPVFEKLREEPIVKSARAARDYWLARLNPKLAPERMLQIAQERAQALPEDALAYYDEGRMLRRLKRFTDAEVSLRKAIEKSDEKSKFLDELGRTLAAQGRLDDALAVADSLIRATPKSPEPGLDLRVAIFALSGKREAALKALQTLLDRYPAWHASAVPGEDLDEFRRQPAVQELLRKARSKAQK